MPLMPSHFLAYLKKFLWERRCAVCGHPQIVTDGDIVLCESCAKKLHPLEKDGYCSWCGQILHKKDARRFLCNQCLLAPPPWQELHLLGAYSGLLRNLLLKLKFRGQLFIAHLLGTLLAQSMPASFGETPFLLLPVPLSPQRLRQRGFNQALEISRPIAKKFSFELDGYALTKRRHTLPQSQLPEKKRLANIRGAFTANSEKIAGRHIILCDDIMTTGSTMKEAALVTRQAGAKSVSILVVARTPPPESIPFSAISLVPRQPGELHESLQ